MKINGNEYNGVWAQFVERQDEWVGNILEDFDMGTRAITNITGIALESNGKNSAYFTIKGEDFNCGFDIRYGGITGGEDGWLTFSGYGGHTFRIETDKRIEHDK